MHMETYNLLRNLVADSFGLLGMFVFFCAAMLFAFRPGSRRHYEEAAQIPLKTGSEE